MEIKPNNIYLGNAYELIKEMQDKSVDLILTDPPYERARTYFVSKTNVADKKDYGHPTCKLTDLLEILIKNSTGRGLENEYVVFDPFLGSGTTCIAAKHCGCKYIGFEINEKYYNIAKDRLQGINQKGELNLFDIDYE